MGIFSPSAFVFAVYILMIGVIAMENQNMNDTDLIKREMSYQVQMLLTKKLLRMGLLTDSEYAEIDTILRQKFRPSLSVFISEST